MVWDQLRQVAEGRSWRHFLEKRLWTCGLMKGLKAGLNTSGRAVVALVSPCVPTCSAVMRGVGTVAELLFVRSGRINYSFTQIRKCIFRTTCNMIIPCLLMLYLLAKASFGKTDVKSNPLRET